ncbi:MAG: domain containing protein [Anaeromyxobacteraceae bacterium]|nr:domain containing protein [Anaeromyxobacteraceae bacterium]
MRRRRVPDLSRRCPGCFFPPDRCLCGEAPRVENRTRVFMLRHWQERVRTTNSGRWAALSLSRCEIVDHAVPGAPLDFSRIPVERAAVLFPSPGGGVPSPPPETLVVLDATWAQARRMLQRIPALQTLPRLSLPGSVAERLREPTVKEGMSTIEALALALDLLGDDVAARALERTWALAVDRGLSLRWSGTARGARRIPGALP